MEMAFDRFVEAAAHNRIVQLVILVIMADMFFGVLRAIRERKFNSSAGINGAIRKVGMAASILFLLMLDMLVHINLIGFLPVELRGYLGLEIVGAAEFFGIIYIVFEVVSVLKNMTLCGLPVKRVWNYISDKLARYTGELPTK